MQRINLPAIKPDRVVPVLLGVIATFVIGVILLQLRSVLVPLSVAILLSFIFQPIVLYLKARRVPTWLALVVVSAALALLLGLIGFLVYSSAQSLTQAFDRYVPRIDTLIDDLQTLVARFVQALGLNMTQLDFNQIIDVASITSVVSSGVGEVATLLANAFLVVLFMMFILAASGELSIKVQKAYPTSVAARIIDVMDNISRQVRQYLVAKTVVSAGTGLLIFLVLWLLGVDFPVFWGFMAFLLNFIPNIGSTVAVVMPSLLSLLQFDTLTIPFIAAGLMWLIQMVMGNIVDPRLMAFSLNLSPVLVLVSLIFWGWLWGIVGMILAVPLTATIKIFFENIDGLRPVAVLMGDVSSANVISPPGGEEG